jgi:DNA-binding transcriptional LysR family regulator
MHESMRKRDPLLGVEIRHLAALEAVADSGSFAVAARRLGYSQSGISQQIAALERAAGMTLLERPGGRRPVTPTEAGARLLRHARRAADAMRAAAADLHALAEGDAGALRVGTFQSAGVRLLPQVMRLYVARRPGIDVRLTEAAYDEQLVDELVRGALDLAFVARRGESVLEHLAVLEDPYVLLAPVGSELATERRPVRVRELAPLPLVGYRRPEEAGEAFLRSRGIEPRVVFRSDESGTVQGLVGAGLGYALVPLLTVERGDPDVARLEVTGIPPREITLAWHADRTLTPAALAFVDVVREVADDLRQYAARR